MLVVCGWVPAGEALGKGVTVLVGCGVSCRGVTVAVGRGPAGMVGVGIGVAVSSGEFASTAVAHANSETRSASLKNRLTTTASDRPAPTDVNA